MNYQLEGVIFDQQNKNVLIFEGLVEDKFNALTLPLEERWYRAGAGQIGQRQFVVADPDGYLLRFVRLLGAPAPT